VQQAFAVVVRFFRQPGVIGKCAQQGLAQRGVDLDISLGDDFVAKAPSAPVGAILALLPAVAGA